MENLPGGWLIQKNLRKNRFRCFRLGSGRLD
jgi:hypothetical protein